MNELDQFKATFFAECDEWIGELESNLGALHEGATDKETLNAIFRAVHSIKAGAGAFQFQALVRFTHSFEALLDHMRNDEVPVVDAVVSVLFRAADVQASMIDLARDGQEPEDGFGAEVLAELEALRRTARPDLAPAEPAPSAVAEEDRDAPATEVYRIVFTPNAELFRHANEPLLLVREMQGLGDLVAEPMLDRLPSLQAMDPEEAYVGWTFLLTTDQGREAVEEVFEFVGDDCELSIETVDDAPAETEAEAAAAAPLPEAAASAAPPASVKGADQSARGAGAAQMGSIRVDLDRIDRLVNMVGELVITQSMLSQQTADLPEERFGTIVRGLEELAMHTRELQESVMAIRMQPVKSVFARMPRLVRELSAKLGKQVRLEVEGENTEVDKTVIEEISDPITHMIRNSLDHGVETPEERQAAGKPAEAVIGLSAEHRSGRILISIRDDGRGIDRSRVLAKAQERGIVAPEQQLTDEEIDNLIFAPGFSTAAQVTDVSGRGVGMDVVRRNVQALGGRISIQNTPGEGARMTMSLPLTLAVMDGMIVASGGEKYVVPISAIVECLRPLRSAVNHLPTGRQVVQVRGEYIPLVFLARSFNLAGAIADPWEALVVLVDTDTCGRVGIVVDELLGQQQVVIKSLEANYDPVAGLSGATILGNGRVAAILDVEGLCTIGGGRIRQSEISEQPASDAGDPQPQNWEAVA